MKGNEGEKGTRTDYPGVKAGTGQNREKSSAHGQILASDSELTGKVRKGRDKHPMKCGTGNHA